MALQPVVDPNQGETEEQQQMRMAMLAAQMQSGGQQSPTLPATSQPQIVESPAGLDPTTAQQAISALPQKPAPDVTMQHATYADQPGAADTAKAQQALSSYQDRPMWRKMLGPGLIAAASALGAHSWGGRQLEENASKDITDLNQASQTHYQSLVQQLETARSMQQAQYEADQRNRQQDIMLAGQNQSRNLVAQIAAGSRQNVAGINATGRENVQGLRNTGNEDVQGLRNTGAENVEGTRAKTAIDVAKINAQAALSRFLAGEGYEDRRQQAGFGHTDTKPTADEDRRADLSAAMSNYADMLIDIAQRRPDLFGPLAGRVTEARQFVGSNDPDVADLKFLKEQLGITQMGAHSLRSAQAIAPIADALANSFKNDAATTIATAEMAKKGVASFMGPQTRPTVNTPNQPAAPTKPPGSLTNRVGGSTPRVLKYNPTTGKLE